MPPYWILDTVGGSPHFLVAIPLADLSEFWYNVSYYEIRAKMSIGGDNIPCKKITSL
jgi:hypothetical protein